MVLAIKQPDSVTVVTIPDISKLATKIVRLVQTSCDFYNEDHPVRQEPIYTPGIGNYYPVRPEFHHLSSPDQLQSLQ